MSAVKQKSCHVINVDFVATWWTTIKTSRNKEPKKRKVIPLYWTKKTAQNQMIGMNLNWNAVND